MLWPNILTSHSSPIGSVFCKLSPFEPFEAETSVPRIDGYFPGFHGDGADDRVEVVTVSFAQRINRNDLSIEVEPLNSAVNESTLGNVNSFSAQRDFVRF